MILFYAISFVATMQLYAFGMRRLARSLKNSRIKLEKFYQEHLRLYHPEIDSWYIDGIEMTLTAPHDIDDFISRKDVVKPGKMFGCDCLEIEHQKNLYFKLLKFSNDWGIERYTFYHQVLSLLFWPIAWPAFFAWKKSTELIKANIAKFNSYIDNDVLQIKEQPKIDSYDLEARKEVNELTGETARDDNNSTNHYLDDPAGSLTITIQSSSISAEELKRQDYIRATNEYYRPDNDPTNPILVNDLPYTSAKYHYPDKRPSKLHPEIIEYLDSKYFNADQMNKLSDMRKTDRLKKEHLIELDRRAKELEKSLSRKIEDERKKLDENMKNININKMYF